MLLPLPGGSAEHVKIEIGSKGKISGYILNGTSGLLMKDVSVAVYAAADSSMVAGTITNGDGSFVISMLAAGTYLIEISHRGFTGKQITGIVIKTEQPEIHIGGIQLEPGGKKTKRLGWNYPDFFPLKT